MSPRWTVLAAAGAAVVAMLWKEMPAIRRYFKIAKM
jgi:uncharacterized protein DUF6893